MLLISILFQKYLYITIQTLRDEVGVSGESLIKRITLSQTRLSRKFIRYIPLFNLELNCLEELSNFEFVTMPIKLNVSETVE